MSGLERCKLYVPFVRHFRLRVVGSLNSMFMGRLLWDFVQSFSFGRFRGQSFGGCVQSFMRSSSL